jgi:hypothetical protein
MEMHVGCPRGKAQPTTFSGDRRGDGPMHGGCYEAIVVVVWLTICSVLRHDFTRESLDLQSKLYTGCLSLVDDRRFSFDDGWC